METKIRVLIVDFNSEFCRLLSEQMRESEDMEVVGTAAGGLGGLRLPGEPEPEVRAGAGGRRELTHRAGRHRRSDHPRLRGGGGGIRRAPDDLRPQPRRSQIPQQHRG